MWFQRTPGQQKSQQRSAGLAEKRKKKTVEEKRYIDRGGKKNFHSISLHLINVDTDVI